MSEFSLPDGLYLSVAGMVRSRFAGQTRAMLLRNRYFTQYAGVATTILTDDDDPVYEVERERLTERGELVPGMRLLNLFEDYRNDPDLVDDLTASDGADALPELVGLEAADVPHPDGTVYYTSYGEPEIAGDLVRDYRRPDGSIFLRCPGSRKTARPEGFTLTDRQSRPVASWPTGHGWRQHWVARLAGDAERVIMIADNRAAMQAIWPVPDERFHVFVLLHNIHVIGNRRWNSPLQPTYQWTFDHAAELDGLLTLTKRQGDDIAERIGRRTNQFDIHNPVTIPDRPEPRPERDPNTFAIVSRLENQKRLDHAVRAFALVVQQRPQARLHIYGRGTLRSSLDALIAELGLGEQVIMKGWDPDARDQLWTAGGMLMTSSYEGFPLASLESLARGCPVVSYDIKYGPREQIADGVDGFLVPEGDLEAMADRVVRLIDDPALVRRMSDAALTKALDYDYRAFLRQWEHILSTGIADRAKRARFERVRLQVHRLGYRPTSLPGRLAARLPLRSGSASLTGSRKLVLDAEVTVRGTWPRGALGRVKITLAAVSRDGTVTPLPLTVTREGRRFALRSRFDLSRALPPDSRPVHLRVRVSLRNEVWEKLLTRATTDRPAYEISFDAANALVLHRGDATAETPEA